MARVVLAPALARWLPGGGDADASFEVPGANVREVLAGLFARQPGLRAYVVDEHGAVRHHVAMFVDGHSLARKTHLDHALGERSELHVMQALSGG